MNENERENLVEGQGGTDNDLDLLEEIKSLKANSVPKDEYQKQVEKNRLLMKQIINGGGQGDKSVETVDINELRKEIFGNSENLTNLEFWKKTLSLRKERLEKEGVDIFLPKGVKTHYSREDLECPNKVSEVIEQCIEDSEDNPEVFTALLNSRIR